MNIPNLSLAPAVPAYMREYARRRIIAFNQRIAVIAARHRLPVVDLFAKTRIFAKRAELFSSDGIHPSDAGYEFWTNILWAETRRRL